MTTVLLIRHGLSTANTAGVLSGWSEGVVLEERGISQAKELAERLTDVPLAGVVTSPLDRCRQTVAALTARRPELPVTVDERVGEVRYGDWTGRSLRDLVKEPLWPIVQQHPSAVVFPGEGGESLRAMQFRAVEAVRDHNERIAAEHGPNALYAVCSHGDVIKAIVADALGIHLDLFQRIDVAPCSLTAIRYTPGRPFLVRLNDTGGAVDSLVPRPAPQDDAADREAKTDGNGEAGPGESDAVVGGGAGGPAGA